MIQERMPNSLSMPISPAVAPPLCSWPRLRLLPPYSTAWRRRSDPVGSGPRRAGSPTSSAAPLGHDRGQPMTVATPASSAAARRQTAAGSWSASPGARPPPPRRDRRSPRTRWRPTTRAQPRPRTRRPPARARRCVRAPAGIGEIRRGAIACGTLETSTAARKPALTAEPAAIWMPEDEGFDAIDHREPTTCPSPRRSAFVLSASTRAIDHRREGLPPQQHPEDEQGPRSSASGSRSRQGADQGPGAEAGEDPHDFGQECAPSRQADRSTGARTARPSRAPAPQPCRAPALRPLGQWP